MAKKDELNFENGNNMAGSEKLKALQAAMDKIEKSFGKGSIMKMGDESVEQVEVIPTGSIGLNDVSLKSTVRNLPVRPRWQSMPSPKHKRQAVSQHSSMRNTLSTASMQPNWV